MNLTIDTNEMTKTKNRNFTSNWTYALNTLTNVLFKDSFTFGVQISPVDSARKTVDSVPKWSYISTPLTPMIQGAVPMLQAIQTLLLAMMANYFDRGILSRTKSRPVGHGSTNKFNQLQQLDLKLLEFVFWDSQHRLYMYDLFRFYSYFDIIERPR